MWRYIVRRLLATIPFIFLVSLTVFALIQLPPGDFVTSYAAKLSASGDSIDATALANMRVRFGLDQPFLVQYFKWIGGILQGDFGYSFEWQTPVANLIGERMVLTLVLSLVTLAFTWCIALPIGIYSAVRRYSVGDYVFTFIGFIGLAVPAACSPRNMPMPPGLGTVWRIFFSICGFR
jgi:peptide/nickel transport system permease protein